MIGDRCENCTAYLAVDVTLPGTFATGGICRAHPPQQVASMAHEKLVSMWPGTKADGWCREHQRNMKPE